MRFTKDGDLIKAVRITGPCHNLLALSFSDVEMGPGILVEELESPSGEPPRLRAEDVQREVCEGVQEANAELYTRYKLARLQFVPSDSPPVEVYRLLAKRIVERLASGEPF